MVNKLIAARNNWHCSNAFKHCFQAHRLSPPATTLASRTALHVSPRKLHATCEAQKRHPGNHLKDNDTEQDGVEEETINDPFFVIFI